MDLDKIVSDLKSERDRIGRAIRALVEGAGLAGSLKRTAGRPGAPKHRKGITPAGRRRLSHAMKARWAARSSKSAATSHTAATVAGGAAPKKRRGVISAAGRKRLSEAMKKRWAEKRKASSKAGGSSKG